MMVQGRTLVTAPTVEPVTLTEVKEHLREDGTAQDSLIEDVLIPAARIFIEKRTWRALVTQTWDFTWYRFPTHPEFDIPMPPLQSVTSVTYYDTDNALQTFTADDYIVDTSVEPGVVRLKEGKSWPDTYARPSAVIVRAVVGYGLAASVPANYKHAVNLLVGHWYANRESVVTGTISTRVQDTVEALLGLDHARAMIG